MLPSYNKDIEMKETRRAMNEVTLNDDQLRFMLNVFTPEYDQHNNTISLMSEGVSHALYSIDTDELEHHIEFQDDLIILTENQESMMIEYMMNYTLDTRNYEAPDEREHGLYGYGY